MKFSYSNKWFRTILLLLIITYVSSGVLSIVIFESFKYDNSVDCQAISNSGMMSDAYVKYRIVRWISPAFIAKRYSRSQNLVTKTYAASLLCSRGNDICITLFDRHFASAEMVNYRCGCLTLEDKVHDVIYWSRKSSLYDTKLDSLEQERKFRADKLLEMMKNFRENGDY